MDRGFMKLWRKLKDSKCYCRGGIHRALLLTIFTEANWKEGSFRGETLLPGQYATTVLGLSKELGFSRSTLQRALSDLESDGVITVENMGNRWTRISLVNWDSYQPSIEKCGQPVGNRWATDGQPEPLHHINTKEVKNIKKKLNKEKSDPLSGLSDELRAAILSYAEHRKALKAPLTEHGMKLTLSSLEKLAPGNEATQIAILEQSIQRGWRGVFALKAEEPSVQHRPQYEWKSPAQRRLEANLAAGEAFLRGETGFEHLMTPEGWQ